MSICQLDPNRSSSRSNRGSFRRGSKPEEEQLIPLLEDGATGYLSKEAAGRDLVAAIRVMASGDIYVRPHVARLLAESLPRSV